MEELDLCISNYDLNDILNLFKIDKDFGKEELNKAKKMVLKMHPDKSRLDKEYFLFFLQAYKLLCSVYEFKNKNEKDLNEDEEYETELIDEDLENKEAWLNLSKKENFNEIFNEMFEKYNEKTREDGYGEWLKQKEDNEGEKANNLSEVNRIIHEKKRDLREVMVIKDVQEFSNGSGSLLIEGAGNFGSGMFSKLGYDDLKTAYTESVVPVSEEDYDQRKKYNSLSDYNVEREESIRKIRSNLNHDNLLKEKIRLENEDNIRRAYNLAKEDENNKILKRDMTRMLHRLT